MPSFPIRPVPKIQPKPPTTITIDYEKLADAVYVRIQADADRFRGPPGVGVPGLNGKDGVNGKDGKDGADGKDGEDASKTDPIAPPIPTDSDSRLMLYYTSRSCKACKPVDDEIAAMKTKGWPIIVTRLSPKDAEVQGVPRIYIPATDRHVVGLSNVKFFLANP